MALTMRLNLATVMREGFTDQQRRALTPLIKSDAIKRQFAREVIDEILTRTESGKDKDGVRFTPYSKAYKESRDFKIFGKSSKVNLRLSGEMHASVGILGTSSNTVTIAIPGGEQEKKARGHINGSGSLPVRDFWGIPMDDQVKILKGILKRQNAEESIEAAESFLQGQTITAAVVQAAGTQETEITPSILAILGDLTDDG